MRETPVVEIREVTKRFGEGPLVLDRLSVEALRGDFVSLIGPSGCGKSTLLRLIAGLSPPSGGTITIAKRSPHEIGPNLGFVFQEPTLLPWLTVGRNVELPQKLRGVDPPTRAETRRHALELVGIAEKADVYPRQLSGGQKMRVSIARALTLTPRILLLDEPFGALDEMTRERLNEELLAIRERQEWTAFFVTHSVTEAVFLSNRIVVMAANPGRVHSEVRISLPYPRTTETRLSRPFQEMVAEVSRVLRSVEAPAA